MRDPYGDSLTTNALKVIGGSFSSKQHEVGGGIDKGEKTVSGYYTDGLVDLYGHIVDPDAMKRAIPEYMEWGNIREMHGGAVGKVVSMADPWNFVKSKIVDDRAWNLVLEEVYKGYSVGISVLDGEFVDAKTVDENMFSRLPLNLVEKIVDEWGEIFVITSLMLVEISIVDRPANPRAAFVKSYGGVEMLPSVQHRGDLIGVVKNGKVVYTGVDMKTTNDAIDEVVDSEAIVEEVEVSEKAIEADVEEIAVEAEADVEAEVIEADVDADAVVEPVSEENDNEVIADEVEVEDEEPGVETEEALSFDVDSIVERLSVIVSEKVNELTESVAEMAARIDQINSLIGEQTNVQAEADTDVDAEADVDAGHAEPETLDASYVPPAATMGREEIAEIVKGIIEETFVESGKGVVYLGSKQNREKDVETLDKVKKSELGKIMATLAARTAL